MFHVKRFTMFHVKQPAPLDNFGAGAPVVEQRLFSAVVQISIHAVWGSGASLLRILARRRQYKTNEYKCQAFLCPFVQIVQIRGVSGAGSRKAGANGGLGDEIGENLGQLEQITLDTVTPRTAPRNSFALFSRTG